MKKLLSVLLLSFLLSFTWQQAHAIITDPDDYIVYDSGTLGDSAVAANFNFDGGGIVRYFYTPGVTIEAVGTVGRSISSNQDLIDMGFPSGTNISDVRNKTMLWGLVINQDNENKNGYYKLDPVLYKQLQRKSDPVLLNYRWDLNKGEGNYYRPSDSLIIRMPADCDSIVIMGQGTNASIYALLAYQLDKGRDAHYYAGHNTGFFVARIGLRPEPVEGQDSVDIVVLAPHKDWYATYTKTEWTSSTENGKLLYAAQLNEDGTPYYIKGERWGMYNRSNILRIKVYGHIEKGEIPPFTGTISGWTFQYRPKETGTVDLNNVISTSAGWGSQTYGKYASDEGVVRSMLTASRSYNMGYDDDLNTFGARLTGLPVTSDTTDYTQNAQLPEGYFQIDFSSTGFQDMTLNMDYVIRNGADSLVVVAKELSAADWLLLGKFANSANPISDLAHISCAIPNSLANKSDVVIRVLQNGGSYSEGAELDIANLRIDGYDDYVAINVGAQKVAYITSAVDRLHMFARSATADSTDKVLKNLINDANIDVTPITADIWSSWTAANIAEAVEDYSVVILSPYIAANASVVTALGSLVGQKPILALNADAYAQWNTSASLTANASADLTADNMFRLHPIFNGMTLGEAADGFMLPRLLSTEGDSALQAINVAAGAGSFVLGAADDAVCFYEDFSQPENKLIYLGIKPEQAAYVNSNCSTLVVKMLAYLAKDKAFTAPTFEINSSGQAIVSNVSELQDALLYDFSPLNLSQSTILLMGGEYALPAGVQYGSGTFVLQPYNSETVTIDGTLASSQTIDINSLTINNMTIKGNAPLFSVKPGDNVSTGIYVDGCTLIGIKTLFAAIDADSAKVALLSLKNSTLEQVGGGEGFIRLAGDSLIFDDVVINENIMMEYAGGTFINWGAPVRRGDNPIDVEITHNTFINATAANADLIAMSAQPKQDSISVVIDNNLFYNTFGASNITLKADSFISVYQRNNLVEGTSFVPGLTAYKDTTYSSNFTKEDMGLSAIFDNEDDHTISKLSKLYTAGSSRTYVGASRTYIARTEPGTFAVHNVTELTDVMNIAIGGDVIELYDFVPASEADSIKYGESGVYVLGLNGFAYPTTGGDLTIRAAEGQHPILFGRISPNNSAKLDALRIVGLTFADAEGFPNFDNENAGPFYFTSAANIGVFHVTQCTFENLQNQRLMRTNNCANLYLGEVRFDYNVFENHGGTMADGEVGAAHFFQFVNGADYTLDRFTFVENIVSNFHGSQLFNIARGGSKGDSAIVIKISNNLFYKLGGNAKDQNRNFLEFNKAPQGCTVDIQIVNNLFYKRWSDVNKPICQVVLYDTAGVKSSNIVISNNYFEGDYYPADGESYGANPVSNSTSEEAVLYNLAQTGGEVEVTRGEPLTWEVLGVDEVFADEATLTIDQSSPLFTAGLNGACIGPKICYGIKEALNSAEMANEGLQAFSRDGRVYVNAARSTELRIYSLTGKMVRSQMLAEGINEVDGLAAGLYIVRVNNAAVKVLVK